MTTQPMFLTRISVLFDVFKFRLELRRTGWEIAQAHMRVGGKGSELWEIMPLIKLRLHMTRFQCTLWLLLSCIKSTWQTRCQQ